MKTAILLLSLASVATAAEPTAAERAAASPDMDRMSMREHMDDDPLDVMLMLDRLELRDASDGTALSWGGSAWIGRDFNKLLLRTEGEHVDGQTVDAELSAFWARPVARWWNQVIGARHDFEPGASRTWLAFGLEGIAPYRLHLQATGYLGERGRTALRLETEYELLLTNRLILQPRAELNAYGKAGRSRGIGSGVSDLDLGLRLRYELRREVAPYLGVSWVARFGSTADIVRANGGDARELQVLAGLRVWY